MSAPGPRSHALLRIVAAVAVTLVAGALVVAMLGVPSPTTRLALAVDARMGHSGVNHPVTAVLLNFRAYDTLLEIAVLLIAVIGALALHQAGGDEATPPAAVAQPVLGGLLHLLVPLMVLLAAYLLWAGAHGPGGAFQAGAALAAVGVLLRLAGRWTPMLPPPALARAGLLVGFAVFLAVAIGAALAGGALLEYPRVWAGVLILLVETALAVSIGMMLVGFFIGAPTPQRR